MKRIFIYLFAIIGICLFGGCQAVFTTSLIAGLAPPADELPPAQLIAYAETVSPDDAAEVLAVIAEVLNDMDESDPAYGELSYAAGNLALDAAGLSFESIVDVMTSGSDPTELINTLESNSDLLVDAANYFDAANGADEELSSTDKILTGVGLALEAAGTPGNPASLSDITVADIESGGDFQEAFNYIEEGVAGNEELESMMYGFLGLS
jgi:hypothetical protein